MTATCMKPGQGAARAAVAEEVSAQVCLGRHSSTECLVGRFPRRVAVAVGGWAGGQRYRRLIRRPAAMAMPPASPMTPPTIAAGRPSSMRANGAVATRVRRPMISPTIAPMVPAAYAPRTVHRASSGKPRCCSAILFTVHSHQRTVAVSRPELLGTPKEGHTVRK